MSSVRFVSTSPIVSVRLVSTSPIVPSTLATSSITVLISSRRRSSVIPISSSNSSFVIPKSAVILSIAVSNASSRVAPASNSAYMPVASFDSSTSVLGSFAIAGEPKILLITLYVAVGAYSFNSANLLASNPALSSSLSGSYCPTNRSTSSCVTSTRPSSS